MHMTLGLGVALVATGWYWSDLRGFYTQAAQAASVFFSDSSTSDTLHKAYRDAERGRGSFDLLIVPGHDDQFSGTSFGGLREADLTLMAAKKLAEEFGRDKNIRVRLARTDAGYDADLVQYFTGKRDEVLEYRTRQMMQMSEHVESGRVRIVDGASHAFATSEAGFRLYGINKWANEQGYDLVIHIHFNDVPRPDTSRPGWPTGFALYVPESQYSNAKGSMAVARAIKERLAQAYRVSTLPQESSSPVEDQELIAVGSNNSLDASSVLIEYSYIYEPLVQDASVRATALETMARLTYLGVEDFLGKKR